jgi:hypothetical protein
MAILDFIVNLYLLLFPIVSILFFLMLFFAIKRYSPGHYSFLTRNISGLGHPERPASARLFNPAVQILGITLLPMGWVFRIYLINSWASFLVAIFISIGGIGLILLGFWRENDLLHHGIASGLSFGCFLLALLFAVFAMWITPDYPKIAILLNVIPWIIFIFHRKAMVQFSMDLEWQHVNIKPWHQNYHLTEWALFFSVVVFIYFNYSWVLWLRFG